MNVIIPPKRRDGRSSFIQLVSYMSVRDDISLKDEIKEDQRFARPARSRSKVFERLVDYVSRNENLVESQLIAIDKRGNSRVSVEGVISQHNAISFESAALEMQSISDQNIRCKDPVYHFILSWQEDENPSEDQIFDSVYHSLRGLGMGNHQYVASIHRDTDNVHVHVAANRVHPVTFKAVNLYNDADKLQRICRALELKHNFKVDNGSWIRDENNNVVRAPRRHKIAPRGAATLEHFADKESLYTYAVTHCRREINTMFRNKTACWESIHNVFSTAGLKLEARGEGMIVRDAFNPEQTPIKASRIHVGMTRQRLESKIGPFVPSLTPPLDLRSKHVHKAYNESLHKRDIGARHERRIARAEARENLKNDYQLYRKSWVKPDLQASARFRDIATDFKGQKQRIRTNVNDPHMRKLMYHVVEFEREKAMAALRLQLKSEREKLRDEGKYRPMSYRAWTEQEALKGREAAVSQLRGWAYREGRKNRVPVESDMILYCAPGDDTKLLKAENFNVRLHRDGSAVYSSAGRDEVIDRGDSIEVRFPLENSLSTIDMGIDLASWKSGERFEITGESYTKLLAFQRLAEYNRAFPEHSVHPTQPEQTAELNEAHRVIDKRLMWEAESEQSRLNRVHRSRPREQDDDDLRHTEQFRP